MAKVLPGYVKIYNLGHPKIDGLLDNPVLVQEKVDGSQFSVGVVDGQLLMRSKNQQVHEGAAPNLFAPAVETAVRLHAEGKLREGFVYRGEAFKGKKHNSLTYGRAPKGGWVLYDVDTDEHGRRLSIDDLEAEAERLGLECVPTYVTSARLTFEGIQRYLTQQSFLGGTLIEGVVVKPAERGKLFNLMGHELMGKFVSASFREKNHKAHKQKADIIGTLCATYRSPARWAKAVQRRRDAGELLHEPKDIGPLMGSVRDDILEECGDEIKDALFKHFWPVIARASVSGLAEWYKEQLAKGTFRE